MGLGKKLLDIRPSDLKNAHKIMSALSILGISEEDLLKIKNIPEMEKEIAELREFKQNVIREAKNETASNNSKSLNMKELAEVFGGKVEEFDPYGKGNK